MDAPYERRQILLDQLRKAGADAQAALNAGMTVAGDEISKLCQELQRVTAGKAAAESANIPLFAQLCNVRKENEELVVLVGDLQASTTGQRATIERLRHKLASAEAAEARAEAQASISQTQLRTLQQGLLALTVGKGPEAVEQEAAEPQEVELEVEVEAEVASSEPLSRELPVSTPQTPNTEQLAAAPSADLASDTLASNFVEAMDAAAAVALGDDEFPPLHAVSKYAKKQWFLPRRVKKYSDSRFKTSLCCHYQTGKCAQGSACTFAHGEHELRLSPGKYHKQVTAVLGMGFAIDAAVIAALFDEHKGDTLKVIEQLSIATC